MNCHQQHTKILIRVTISFFSLSPFFQLLGVAQPFFFFYFYLFKLVDPTTTMFLTIIDIVNVLILIIKIVEWGWMIPIFIPFSIFLFLNYSYVI